MTELVGLQPRMTRMQRIDSEPFVSLAGFAVEEKDDEMAEILFPDESYAIMGACFEVHNQLGAGFIEPVYQEALEIELGERGIPFTAQQELEIVYKGRRLQQTYKPDFICFGVLILEIKAVSSLNDTFRAQVHNYLKATGLQLGILVNFSAHPKLEYERIVRTKDRNRE